ncbi:unnamed protein product [Tenebrio molitor]|nr:unnamed protein product [Tenebrio molitor]
MSRKTILHPVCILYLPIPGVRAKSSAEYVFRVFKMINLQISDVMLSHTHTRDMIIYHHVITFLPRHPYLERYVFHRQSLKTKRFFKNLEVGVTGGRGER